MVAIHDRQQLSELYGRASIFVMPSLYESWGHVFLEAMGHGLPCIGTDAFAMREIIEDGVTGLLVERNDHEALAAAIVELLANPHECDRMGRAAYSRAFERHKWQDVVDRMAPYIESAVGSA